MVDGGLVGLAVAGVAMLGSYYAQKYAPPPKPFIVGIDLGTTYSVIGVYHAGPGEVEIIPDALGRRCIPSVVAFTPKGQLVGLAAKSQGQANPVNTIFDAKRFMGKPATEKLLADTKKRYPFRVVDKGGKPHFVVQGADGDGDMVLPPEAIGGMIISTLKQSVEDHLSAEDNKTDRTAGAASTLLKIRDFLLRRAPKPIKLAVIAVPAEFNAAQRKATVAAAALAGLDVLRVINEPTAAAMAYGIHGRAVEGGLIVVFDFGGGTLDVSLLGLQGGTFITLAIAGNSQLGGEDLTHRLFQLAVRECEARALGGREAAPMLKQRLRLAADQAKITLSHVNDTLISVHTSEGEESTGDDMFEMAVTRDMFEELNKDLFDQVLRPVQHVLRSATMPASSVSDVVLVGGSTRIPRVRVLLTEFFGMPPNAGINPDEAVAIGVAVQAGIMGGAWPLQVAATEVSVNLRKIELSDLDEDEYEEEEEEEEEDV